VIRFADRLFGEGSVDPVVREVKRWKAQYSGLAMAYEKFCARRPQKVIL
jgi:hypothetical protein